MLFRSSLPVTILPLLLKVKEPQRQEHLANLVTTRQLTVYQLELMLAQRQAPPPSAKLTETNPSARTCAPLPASFPNKRRYSSRRTETAYTHDDAVRDLQASVGRYWAHIELGVPLPLRKNHTLKNYLKIERSYKMLLLR